jgi:hypothetical protein
MNGRHGSIVTAANQCVPKQGFPIFCKELTGPSLSPIVHASQSLNVPKLDLLKYFNIAFRSFIN